MVSDVVLLKKLPEEIRNSVEAYVGCLSGAMIKDNYTETIRQAGFEEVRIIEETRFPIKYMSNDPTAKAVVKNSTISLKDVKEIGDAVSSVKVFGIKPHQ